MEGSAAGKAATYLKVKQAEVTKQYFI